MNIQLIALVFSGIASLIALGSVLWHIPKLFFRVGLMEEKMEKYDKERASFKDDLSEVNGSIKLLHQELVSTNKRLEEWTLQNEKVLNIIVKNHEERFERIEKKIYS